MANSTKFFVLICLILGASLVEGIEKSKVYIIYLGATKHDDPRHTVDSHHIVLANVVGSKEIASDLMIYNYKHGFSGFAAKLTKSQAKKIADHPDVVNVIPNTYHKLQTTRSWDYLGLSPSMPNNLLNKANSGDGIIIGVIDSGIWPESPSFRDAEMGPIPSRWKGKCVSGQEFNPTLHCNNKIIGAQYFMDAFLNDDAKGANMTEIKSINVYSPRDNRPHGTHVASIAAGSYVSNASYMGLARGTLRGGAPKAHIAAYKVCWFYSRTEHLCSVADIAQAIDQAIYDGVDVIQVSIATDPPFSPEVGSEDSTETIASLHAVLKGITVVFGGGNSGSLPQTVANPNPWVITVGASTIDRYFPTPITLGNNQTLIGRSIATGNEPGFTGLVYMDDYYRCGDYGELENGKLLAGKVVLCFSNDKEAQDETRSQAGIQVMMKSGAAGVIMVKSTRDLWPSNFNNLRIVEVDVDVGTEILWYHKSTSSPTVNLSNSKSVVGEQYAMTKVAYFSSRGPNSMNPAILKPDIVAPGVNILAAMPSPDSNGGAAILSGTSMAAPHVSGVIALLKQSHPDWSPAALKSAIMTTASTANRYGFPIFAEGRTNKIADPFDMGAGVMNPNGAFDPGLVYDMDMTDYAHYFCAMGYDDTAISKVLNQSSCPEKRPSILDVNLPSITIPSLKTLVTLKRTVTNVGPQNSAYKVKIEPPFGTAVSVNPNVLVFNSKTKKVSFNVTVTATHLVNMDYYNFGSLTWTDGVRAVRSPISVKTEVKLPF